MEKIIVKLEDKHLTLILDLEALGLKDVEGVAIYPVDEVDSGDEHGCSRYHLDLH